MIHTDKEKFWNGKREAALIELKSLKCSTKECGHLLGCTRNAVIAKLYRISHPYTPHRRPQVYLRWTNKMVAQLRSWAMQGKTSRQMAYELGCSMDAVKAVCKRNEIKLSGGNTSRQKAFNG